MSKIKNALLNKKGYIGFITAGDPSLEKTEEFVLEIERAGAALVEIGVPFSDPIAEGPSVQNANVRALAAGCTTDKVFEMVKSLRQKTQIPLMFCAYLNTLYKYGYDKFCVACQEAGVDGVIIPDMPYEERGEITPIAEKYGIDIISLVAPSTKERIQTIAKEATGLIYMISSEANVSDGEIITDTEEIVKTIHEVTDVPVAVEAGINTREQVAKYSAVADGAIAGSGIIKLIGKHGAEAGPKVYEYVSEMVNALAK